MTATASLKTSYVLDFSVEELGFLLRALNIPGLAGFQIPMEFDEKTASIAGRSLLARGVATLTSEGIYLIEEKLAAIVASGAIFSTMLYIVCESKDKELRKYWFYLTPNLTILHSKPQSGIERFQTVPDGMSFLLLLTGVIGHRVDVAPLHNDYVLVSRTLIEKALDLKQNNEIDMAYQMIVEDVGNEDFALAVIDPLNRIGFSIAKPGLGHIQAGMILETERGYWMVNQDQTNLQATFMDTRKVLDYISDGLLA
jgi:hypothetical protein